MSASPQGSPTDVRDATPRAQPFYCPYCAEDDLRPDEEPEAWFCPSCARAFLLRFLAVRR